MGKVLTYTAALVGLYLIVRNWEGFTRSLGAGKELYSESVRTLQGR